MTGKMNAAISLDMINRAKASAITEGPKRELKRTDFAAKRTSGNDSVNVSQGTLLLKHFC